MSYFIYPVVVLMSFYYSLNLGALNLYLALATKPVGEFGKLTYLLGWVAVISVSPIAVSILNRLKCPPPIVYISAILLGSSMTIICFALEAATYQ